MIDHLTRQMQHQQQEIEHLRVKLRVVDLRAESLANYIKSSK